MSPAWPTCAIAAPTSRVDREEARAGFATGVRAEWTKLRSVRSTWLALGALVSVDVRGRLEEFEVVKPPFVQPSTRE